MNTPIENLPLPEFEPKQNRVSFPNKRREPVEQYEPTPHPMIPANAIGFGMKDDSLAHIGISQSDVIISAPISENADISELIGKLCVFYLPKENITTCRRLILDKRDRFELRAGNNRNLSRFVKRQDFIIRGVITGVFKFIT